MPTRGVAWFIVLLFVAMVGWQLARAYLEPLQSAPRLKVALEEAVKDDQTHWTLYHNGRRIGTSRSKVRVDQGSGYVLQQSLRLDGDLTEFLNLKVLKALFRLEHDFELTLQLETTMRVTYLGSLISMDARAGIKLTADSANPEISCSVMANADDGFLRLAGSVNVLGHKMRLPDDYRIRYDSKNLIFGSLNPADVMPGLVPGQQWDAPVIDLSSLIAAPSNMTSSTLDLPDRKPIRVRVKEEMQALDWHGSFVACHVVECKQRGLLIQLWVRAGDGRVLKQTARWGESTVIEIVRDLPKPRAGVEVP
ncbi:MAG TPA: hypothetical protein PKC45_05480 [Gemmatales bacterium]|nr:hypothetical protein [Gemmatales bacterium]